MCLCFSACKECHDCCHLVHSVWGGAGVGVGGRMAELEGREILE